MSRLWFIVGTVRVPSLKTGKRAIVWWSYVGFRFSVVVRNPT